MRVDKERGFALRVASAFGSQRPFFGVGCCYMANANREAGGIVANDNVAVSGLPMLNDHPNGKLPQGDLPILFPFHLIDPGSTFSTKT